LVASYAIDATYDVVLVASYAIKAASRKITAADDLIVLAHEGIAVTFKGVELSLNAISTAHELVPSTEHNILIAINVVEIAKDGVHAADDLVGIVGGVTNSLRSVAAAHDSPQNYSCRQQYKHTARVHRGGRKDYNTPFQNAVNSVECSIIAHQTNPYHSTPIPPRMTLPISLKQ
jgi:hypothetical protein